MDTLRLSAISCIMVLFAGFAIVPIFATDYSSASDLCREYLKYGSKHYEDCLKHKEQQKKKENQILNPLLI